jgi:hypothetical protein
MTTFPYHIVDMDHIVRQHVRTRRAAIQIATEMAKDAKPVHRFDVWTFDCGEVPVGENAGHAPGTYVATVRVVWQDMTPTVFVD